MKVRIVSGTAALIASLCCAGPLLLAALGILSIPVAGAIAERLFYSYWWAFVSLGLAITVASILYYYRVPQSCSVDERIRARLIRRNSILAGLALFAGAYIVFDFVIVEFLGVHMGLWRLPHR